MSKNILLAGCGQLGSRHLQAAAAVPGIGRIEVLDPNPASLALGKSRLNEVEAQSSCKIAWVQGLDQVDPGCDLCIIATQAQGRAALIKEIALRTRCTRFLIEKVVTQSAPEFEQLLEFVRLKKLKVWVNCQTRTYEIYRYIKSVLDPSEPIYFAAVGGNHGLACNGIHEIDLFLYLDGHQGVLSRGNMIDPILHPSKRGPGLYDLSGTLMAASSKGSRCFVHFSNEGKAPDNVIVVTNQRKFIIDQLQFKALESCAHDNWIWHERKLDENIYVSFMSRKFIAEILENDACGLPSLEESGPAHQYLLNELLPHFSQLLGRPLDHCPVT